MTGSCFVDTNVFLYAHDAAEPENALRAQAWLAELGDSGSGRISYQVVQELYANLIRKRLVPPETAQRLCRALMGWQPVAADAEILESAWAIGDRYGLSFWDAMIVAAALRQGCRYLLTEDLQHGQVIEGVRVVSPFEAEPRALGGDGF